MRKLIVVLLANLALVSGAVALVCSDSKATETERQSVDFEEIYDWNADGNTLTLILADGNEYVIEK